MSTPYWRCIHYFAYHNLRELLIQVKEFFPEDLRGAWCDPSPTENLVEWSRVLHNKMNTLSGKYDKWDTNDFAIAHKVSCDICTKNLVHRFPWEFIHSVAAQKGSMQFLKDFNRLYPCETCRGRFFDEPRPDETTLEWTYRNNARVDSSFVIPPPVDPLVPYGYQKDLVTNILTVIPGFKF